MTDREPLATPHPALSRDLRRGLRAAALHLKEQRARGQVPPTVWAGTPGLEDDPASTASFATPGQPGTDGLDDGVRLEVTLALAQVVASAVPRPHFWLTRSGEPDLWTGDHAWARAVWSSCRVLDLPPSFTVVTRTGWIHQPTGTTHRWKRLRA